MYVAGGAGGAGTGSDFTTIKYNPSGSQYWIIRYYGPFNRTDVATAITRDEFGTIYITGFSEIEPARMVCTTVKYNQSLISLEDYEHSTPNKIYLSQNYPNPFNHGTRKQYTLPLRAFVTIKIYNLLGEEVATLVNEEKPAGNHWVSFDGSSLPSGVYLYRITAAKYTKTKKFLVMK
ncbi:MAG: hypothetical protein Kow0042_22850 [Calditrichia bacterium]